MIRKLLSRFVNRKLELDLYWAKSDLACKKEELRMAWAAYEEEKNGTRAPGYTRDGESLLDLIDTTIALLKKHEDSEVVGPLLEMLSSIPLDTFAPIAVQEPEDE